MQSIVWYINKQVSTTCIFFYLRSKKTGYAFICSSERRTKFAKEKKNKDEKEIDKNQTKTGRRKTGEKKENILTRFENYYYKYSADVCEFVASLGGVDNLE